MYSVFRKDLIDTANQVLEEHLKFETGGYTSDNLHRIQMGRFRDVVKFARGNSSFYKSHFSAVEECSHSQFTKQTISTIPFTTKNDLREAKHNICSMPLDNAWVYYETTGTTGTSTPCPRSELDSIVNNTPLILRYREIFSTHGEKHIVAVMGPTELHSTGDTFEDVLRSLGHTVVKMWPRSPVVGQKRALKLCEELGITALICTPAVASDLARTAQKSGFDVKQLGIRLILTLGELITPNRLKNIGSIWGATAYNCMYASQESSILAVCKQDNHLHTVPLNNYYELVDPETENLISVSEDVSAGELVITNLYLGQKPLIRYRTGDMVRSQLSSDGGWIIEPIGRVKDKLRLNGQVHTAYDVESILFDNLENCLEYSIVIDRDGTEDLLTIILEMKNGEQEDSISTDDLSNKVQQNLGVKSKFVFGSPDLIVGTAAMVSWKAARVHDRRLSTEDMERVNARAIANARSSVTA